MTQPRWAGVKVGGRSRWEYPESAQPHLCKFHSRMTDSGESSSAKLFRHRSSVQGLGMASWRLRVAARAKGLWQRAERHRHYQELGHAFQTFVGAFKLKVGPVDKHGLGAVLMGDDDRSNFVQKLVEYCLVNPRLKDDVLCAADIVLNLQVSPSRVDPEFAFEYAKAVKQVCSSLCIDEIAAKLLAAAEIRS